MKVSTGFCGLRSPSSKKSTGLETIRAGVFLGAAVLVSGCATYTTPGAGINVGDLSQSTVEIAEVMRREAAAEFPARIAVVRVQAPGYVAGNGACHGQGRYCIVTARDIETEDEYQRLGRLSAVAGVGPISAILLPSSPGGIEDLRLVAANLKADMVLIYSVDTRFHVDGRSLGPLSVVSLGMIPNKRARVSTTAAAVLVDVRTGFVYGIAEATASDDQRATIWSTHQAIERARAATERQSFIGLVGEVEKLWPRILEANGIAVSDEPT